MISTITRFTTREQTTTQPYSFFPIWPGKIRTTLGIIVAAIIMQKIIPWNDTSLNWISTLLIIEIILFAWWQGEHITTLCWRVLCLYPRNHFSTRADMRHKSLTASETCHHDYASYDDLLVTGILQIAPQPHLLGDATDFPWKGILPFLYRFGVYCHRIRIICEDKHNQQSNHRKFYVSFAFSARENAQRIAALHTSDISDISQEGSYSSHSCADAHIHDKLIRLKDNTLRRIQEELQQQGWTSTIISSPVIPAQEILSHIEHEKLSYAITPSNILLLGEENNSVVHNEHECSQETSLTSTHAPEKSSAISQYISTIYALHPARLAHILPVISTLNYPHITTVIDVCRTDVGQGSHISSHQVLVRISALCVIISHKPLPRKNFTPGMWKLRGYIYRLRAGFSFPDQQSLSTSQVVACQNLHDITWSSTL